MRKEMLEAYYQALSNANREARVTGPIGGVEMME